MRSFISWGRKSRRGGKAKSGSSPQKPQETTQQYLYRYRKQRGVNLGELTLDASAI